MTHGIEDASEPLRRLWESYGPLHLPYRLQIVAKMLERLASASILKGERLTLAEWRVMANLLRTGASTVNALAAESYVDRAEVSRASRALVQQGLVERGVHPSSRTKRLLRLSDAGRLRAERIAAQRRAFFAWLTEGLSAEQCQAFDDMLLHFAVRIEHWDQTDEANGQR